MFLKRKNLALSALVLLLAAISALIWRVDDWSRDLSTNYAETSPEAKDPTLRTLELASSVDEVRTAIAQFC